MRTSIQQWNACIKQYSDRTCAYNKTLQNLMVRLIFSLSFNSNKYFKIKYSTSLKTFVKKKKTLSGRFILQHFYSKKDIRLGTSSHPQSTCQNFHHDHPLQEDAKRERRNQTCIIMKIFKLLGDYCYVLFSATGSSLVQWTL